MIIEIEDVLAFEMLAEQQETQDESDVAFSALLLAILASVQAGEPLKETKKIIRNSNVNVGLKKNLSRMITEQNENITDEKDVVNFNTATIAGFTFNELIKNRELTTIKQATRFMAIVSDTIADNRTISQAFIKEEVEKYIRSLNGFYTTQAKAGREFGYAKNDKTLSKEVRGWISIAILDSGTTPICLRLHNKFYAKSAFIPTRFDIPFQIPRHPRCRSNFVTVFRGTSVSSYRGLTIDKFLRQNPKQATAVLGIEKYRLFLEGNKKINNFIDVRSNRFFTNKEIRQRLNIKD